MCGQSQWVFSIIIQKLPKNSHGANKWHKKLSNTLAHIAIKIIEFHCWHIECKELNGYPTHTTKVGMQVWNIQKTNHIMVTTKLLTCIALWKSIESKERLLLSFGRSGVWPIDLKYWEISLGLKYFSDLLFMWPTLIFTYGKRIWGISAKLRCPYL